MTALSARLRRHAARAVGLLAVPVIVMLGAATPAAAAPELAGANVDVAFSDEAADVRIAYRVTGGSGGEAAGSLSLSALAFGDAAIGDVRIIADGKPLDVKLTEAGLKTTATVALPTPLAAGDEFEFDVRYRVAEAVRTVGDLRTATVPVLALNAPPPPTAPGVFSAKLTWPDAPEYVSGFPSSPESVTTADGSTVIRYELPTAAAVLRSVATTGSPPFFTLGRSVELLMLLVIAASVAAGLLRARRANRPAEKLDVVDEHAQPAGTAPTSNRS